MMAIPFDTLKLVERLEAAGMPTKQAKVQAEVLAEVIGAENGKLATKADLETLQAKTDAAIADAKAELVRWVVGVGVLQMALIAGLVLKLIH